MKYKMRPFAVVVLGAGAFLLVTSPVARAQSLRWGQLFGDSAPMAVRSGAVGYLGVDVADLDNEKAGALRLKEAHGALITLIDHDAPAGQGGLRLNDVVLSVNGQTIDNSEQLRRILRESPVGRKLAFTVSRDGNLLNFTIQLADRKAIEQEAIHRIGTGPAAPPIPGGGSFSMLANGAKAATGDEDSPSFHMPSRGNSLNVGALVEPLTAQMADYLGLPSGGVMIKQVARKSQAEVAGLKEHDVILKIGAEPVTTMADWDRALRGNLGKPVTVIILREKKQQTLTLQVDSKRG